MLNGDWLELCEVDDWSGARDQLGFLRGRLDKPFNNRLRGFADQGLPADPL